MLKFLWRGVTDRPQIDIPEAFRRHGYRVYDRVCELADIGERYPGSPGHKQTQDVILSELQALRCDVETVPFVAETPIGKIELVNIIAKFSSTNGPISVLSGHYDTIRPECVSSIGRRVALMRHWMKFWGKPMPTNRHGVYVGANDGGSSTAMLLEMAGIVDGRADIDNVWIVFFDGEEAITEWSEHDQTYGSRHQVRAWDKDGVLDRIRWLVNVDMIGGADFEAMYELNSSPSLRDHLWDFARTLGYESYFPKRHRRRIGDDHVPFVRAGVEAVDIIDAEYGPGNSYWHTLEDIPDKLDPRTFAVLSHLLTEFLVQGGRISSCSDRGDSLS